MVKIAYIITGLTVGGAQQFLLSMLPRMDRRKYAINVIGLYHGRLASEFEKQGIDVIELNLQGLFDPKTFIQLLRILHRLNPDIVHTHLGKADAYGRVAAKIVKTPVIVSTCHNVESWKQNIFYNLIDSMTLRLADKVIAVSNTVRESICIKSSKRLSSISVVYNSIEVPPRAKQHNMKSASEGTPYIIALIGRLEEQKGHKYFLRSLQILKTLKIPVKALIVGGGSLRNDLEDLAAEYNLGPNDIEFCGIRRNIYELLMSIDVLVISSLWEGLPSVLLEAMGIGIPVVATSVGGIPEAVVDGETGYLVPPKEPETMAVKIAVLLSDFEMRRRMGVAARRVVQEKFNIDIAVREHEEIYEELLSQKGGTA